MKILYVVESAAPYGANKSLIDLIDYMHEFGVTTYVAGSESGPLERWLESRAVPYYVLGHKLSIYPRAGSFIKGLLFVPKLVVMRIINLIALFRLITVCRDLKPDIIHTNIGPCAIGYWAARILGIKHVWHLREYQDLDFNLKFFPSKRRFQNLLAKSDFVICITNAIARHFSYPGRFRVINDGVATGDKHYYEPIKENYFLFAGRLEATKGIETVINSYLKFCSDYGSSHNLLIAGDGDVEYVDGLKKIVANSNYSANVKFLGFRNDTLTLMRKARTLIVASRSEGFGRITPEAMFNGCLVIGRNTGGTAEILSPNSREAIGLLFDDDASLVECMNDAVNMSFDVYQGMVLRAQAKAIEKYCIERHSSEVYAVYCDVLKYGV